MKFNYENFPVLEKLDKGIFGTIGINPDHSHLTMRDMRETFKRFVPEFRKDIKYISSTLQSSMLSAGEKLMTPELIMKVESCSGTILMKDGFGMCYFIDSTGDPRDEFLEYVLFVFKGNILLCMDIVGTPKEDLKVFRACYSYDGYGKAAEPMCIQAMGNLMLTLNFLKYADTETIIAEPSRPLFEGVNCLYNNKSKHNIQIIDSKWITTLIKSDAFKVRGHFRLQPCGHGLKDKKLIWINEFQKEGYTREAKILSEHPDTAGTL